MDKALTPEMLAMQPTIEDCEPGPYDWRLQGRGGPILAGQRQTFNSSGKPNDSTSTGSGQTNQTFSSNGQPNDSSSDK
jgi:hypothetical protein